jgi:hypothetical protein
MDGPGRIYITRHVKSVPLPTGIFFAAFLVYMLGDPSKRRRVFFSVLPPSDGATDARDNYSIHRRVMPLHLFGPKGSF